MSQVCLSFSHALPAQSSKKSTQRALMYRTGISRKKIRASNFLNTPSKDQFFSSALVPIKQLAVFEPQPPSDRSSKVSRYLKCDSRENQRESFNNCVNLVLVFKNCAILQCDVNTTWAVNCWSFITNYILKNVFIVFNYIPLNVFPAKVPGLFSAMITFI